MQFIKIHCCFTSWY